MDLIEALLGPFQFEFMVRALIAAAIVGATCSLVGCYVVVRGMAFLGDAMAHVILPGVVIAYLLGVSVLLGALVAGLVSAVLIGLAARQGQVNEQTAIGIVFAGAFALGVALLSTVRSYAVDLTRFLFGNVLGVSATDLLVSAVLAVAVGLTLLAFHRQLGFVAFDPAGARAHGLAVGRLDYLLLGLLAVTIVVSLQTVGNVLVISMLVTPAATARLLVTRFASMLWVAPALGVAEALAGLYLSYYLNTSAGATIVLLSVGVFALVALVRSIAVGPRPLRAAG